jgi:hypothetical protein
MPAPPHERSKEEAMLAAEVDLLPPAFCEAFIGAVGGIDVRPYTLKLTLTTTFGRVTCNGTRCGVDWSAFYCRVRGLEQQRQYFMVAGIREKRNLYSGKAPFARKMEEHRGLSLPDHMFMFILLETIRLRAASIYQLLGSAYSVSRPNIKQRTDNV